MSIGVHIKAASNSFFKIRSVALYVYYFDGGGDGEGDGGGCDDGRGHDGGGSWVDDGGLVVLAADHNDHDHDEHDG